MKAFRLCLIASVAALALSLNASVAFSQVFSDAVITDPVSEVVGGEYYYSPYGAAGFGYTAYGYRPLAYHPVAAGVVGATSLVAHTAAYAVRGAGRLAYFVLSGGSYIPYAPYAPSYYQYSPGVYGTDPEAQWTYHGRFLGIPAWEYTPQLIPPRPYRAFRCCHNSGLCTPECPCCPLCNINGCCDAERAIEAGEDYAPSSTQNPSLAPVPAAVPKASNGSMGVPAKASDDVPEEAAPDADSSINSLLDSANSSKVKTSQVSWSKPNPDGTPSNRLSNIDVRSSRGVVFTIWAPNQAKVYVNGAQTNSIGSKRTFASVNLKPGLKYQYVIDAVVEKDGKTYSESKTIVVSAGDVKTVAFAFPELNTIPSDEWSGEF